MRYLILVLIFYSQSGFALSWDQRVEQELLTKCERFTKKTWATKYRELELEYVKQEKTMKDPKNFAELLFPQQLSDETPMKGALLLCYDSMKAYLKASDQLEVVKTKERPSICYSSDFGQEMNSVRDQFLECLKKQTK